MADLQQFFTKSLSSSTKLNRRIMYGPSNELWPVPQGTTEVEVHVWGGGGSSCRGAAPFCSNSGGGGGGYARARYSVTSTDCLCITVGGNGGTSSVIIATQSPTSPVSATGGGNGSIIPGSPCPQGSGGVGGIGTYSLGPAHPTVYSFTANGGNGSGSNYGCCCASGGGAGSPFGQGGGGATSYFDPPRCSLAAGGGIGTAFILYDFVPYCSSSSAFGGSKFGSCYESTITTPSQSNAIFAYCPYLGCIPTINPIPFTGAQDGTPQSYINFEPRERVSISNPGATSVSVTAASRLCIDDDNPWFYVEDMPGMGSYAVKIDGSNLRYAFAAQDGGGGTTVLNAGLLGGGGGGVVPTSCPGNCISCPGDFTCVYNTGRAGCAGGAGSPSCLSSSIPGTPGVVIIYW